MKIGMVSDSHGADKRLEAALTLLKDGGADAIVHCGDVDDRSCLSVLADCGMPVYLCAGNMDRHFEGLSELCDRAGIVFGARSVELGLPDGRWLVALHGHDGGLFDELVAGQQFAYIIHGHTHQRRDLETGNVRIINPGAVERADPLSAALLDTHNDDLIFFDLPR